MDRELKTFLDSYEVRDADEALIDRIVDKAQQSKHLPFAARSRYMPAARVAALVLCAVLGFSTGMFTQTQQSQQYAQNTNQVTGQATGTKENTGSDYSSYNTLFNPQSFEEIQL